MYELYINRLNIFYEGSITIVFCDKKTINCTVNLIFDKYVDLESKSYWILRFENK